MQWFSDNFSQITKPKCSATLQELLLWIYKTKQSKDLLNVMQQVASCSLVTHGCKDIPKKPLQM